MKKMLLVSFVFLAVVVGLVPHVFAQGFVPLAGIPGLTEGTTADSSGLAAFFNNLYKYLIGLAAALAVIEIIWGGLEISTQDSVSKQSAGKERITQAIFGLVLVLSPVLVFSIINPSILNLSLNLPELETKSATPTQTEQQGTLPICTSIIRTNCVPRSDVVPTNESVTVAKLPTCGPTIPGSCVTASAPACTSGQYCYTTTDDNHVGSVVCSASQSACTSLYDQQAGGGIKVTSTCSLCP
jgi:hypothetical protein